MEYALDHWVYGLWVLVAVGLLLAYRQLLWLFGIRIVADDSSGIVTKKFVIVGRHRRLPDGKIIALAGEAG